MHAATNKRTALYRDGDGGVDEARERAESRELRDGGRDGVVRSAGNEVRDRGNVPRRRRRVAPANNPLRPAHARVTKITRAAVQQAKKILWGMRWPPSPKIKFVVKHLTNLKEKQSGIENKPTSLWRRRPREHRNEDEDLNRKGVNNTSFHLKDFVVLQGFYRGAPWATRSAQTREPLPYAPVAPLYAYTVGKPLGIRRVVCPT
jgi:hypothetical protein